MVMFVFDKKSVKFRYQFLFYVRLSFPHVPISLQNRTSTFSAVESEAQSFLHKKQGNYAAVTDMLSANQRH